MIWKWNAIYICIFFNTCAIEADKLYIQGHNRTVHIQKYIMSRISWMDASVFTCVTCFYSISIDNVWRGILSLVNYVGFHVVNFLCTCGNKICIYRRHESVANKSKVNFFHTITIGPRTKVEVFSYAVHIHEAMKHMLLVHFNIDYFE